MNDLVMGTIDSPVGVLRIVASDIGLRAILWECDTDRVRYGSTTAVEVDEHPIVQQTVVQLREYFDHKRTEFQIPFDVRGTEFQVQAWMALATIAYGSTATYTEQATRIGRPTAVRAIGAANGRNPVSIVLPCHRVIGASGDLTGFAGGLDAKRWLLNHERQTTSPTLF